MIFLRQREEIDKLRASNVIVADILEEVKSRVRSGITTLELDRIAEELCIKRGAKPAFKCYRGYPFSLCISVNNEVVHGLPSQRTLMAGDVVSLDYGVLYKGYYGDAAVTVAIGQVSAEAERLIKVTEESLYLGIDQARVGNRLGDISATVQGHVEKAGFSVVRDFVGHGIGRSLHEEPQIPNFGKMGRGVALKAGMVLAIEPMVNAGSYQVEVLQDGWTVLTVDGKLSAHFEHSVAITDNGPEILSKRKS